MRPIRIGMVGYGGIGRVHVLGYRALLSNYALPARTVQIVGVATSQPESARKAAEEIGCDVWTDDFRALISRDDIDVIDCCTPNRMHEAVLVAGAAAGKHLYCEKPLSLGMADAVRILAAARAADVHTRSSSCSPGSSGGCSPSAGATTAAATSMPASPRRGGCRRRSPAVARWSISVHTCSTCCTSCSVISAA
jgi:hypothetical protein